MPPDAVIVAARPAEDTGFPYDWNGSISGYARRAPRACPTRGYGQARLHHRPPLMAATQAAGQSEADARRFCTGVAVRRSRSAL